jgi:hypothetical protein
MGIVYEALDPVLERVVALKAIALDARADEAARYQERLLLEARAAAALNHPNIVTIHDAGRSGELAYITMEYLEGRALEQLMAAELARGREREILAELRQLVTEHPLRERLQGQLMLALYRTGRQADALEAYRRYREALVDELGLEPGADLRELEAAILNQDSALDAPRKDGAEQPPDRRRRRLPALMAIGTVAGVITGMWLLGDPGREHTGAATTLGASAPTAERAFQAGVVEVCNQVNAAFRAHRRETEALRRELQAARRTALQRAAILLATRRTTGRGSHNLAAFRALQPPSVKRTTYTRTLRAWAASLDSERAYATAIDRAQTRQQLRAAVSHHSAGRADVERNLESVHAGLLALGGSACEIDLYVPAPISLPDLSSVEPVPMRLKNRSPPDGVKRLPVPSDG